MLRFGDLRGVFKRSSRSPPPFLERPVWDVEQLCHDCWDGDPHFLHIMAPTTVHYSYGSEPRTLLRPSDLPGSPNRPKSPKQKQPAHGRDE